MHTNETDVHVSTHHQSIEQRPIFDASPKLSGTPKTLKKETINTEVSKIPILQQKVDRPQVLETKVGLEHHVTNEYSGAVTTEEKKYPEETSTNPN